MMLIKDKTLIYWYIYTDTIQTCSRHYNAKNLMILSYVPIDYIPSTTTTTKE